MLAQENAADNIDGVWKLFGQEIHYLPKGNVLEVVGSITIFELLSVIGFGFFLITVVLAVNNSVAVAATRRAEFSFRVWEAFMREEVQQAFHEIEYDKFGYPYAATGHFESPEQEQRVDRLLYLLDEVALLSTTKVFRKQDVDRWAYQGQRVFRNVGVQQYLQFLDRWFVTQGRKSRPHDLARRLFGPNDKN